MDKELRILILEDVPTDAELVERELNRAGILFSSKRVETRDDFLKELKDFAPDLILSDYKLPHFDGMAALEITKEVAPTIPFIIITGSMNEETAVECMKAGAIDYVIKDHLARIGPAVKGALENKKVREEKARLEEALWKSAREWRATFDALNDPLALMDLGGRIQRCNKGMANLLGKGFNEIIGRNCCELVHGGVGFIEGCPVARMIESQHRETLVLSIGDRWFNIIVDPLLDENRHLIGAVHLVSDITERKQAEEVLASERQRLFDVLETLPAMICLLTPDYHVAFANRSFRNKFGESRGRHCYEYCFGQTGPCKFCEAFEVLKTGKPHHWEVAARDGSVIDVYDFPFTDIDGSPMILEMDIDITERKRAEEALRESEERYRNILETIEEGYFEVDIAGNFTFFNDSLSRLLGYSRDEMMGMNNRQYTDEENTPKLYQAFNRVYRTGEPTKAFDWGIIRKDGTKRYIESSVSLIKNISGQPIGFRGVVRDITERKKVEEALRQTEEQLRQSQKMEGIGRLAGGIAHDFNNLLTVIKGYSQLSLSSVEQGHPLKRNLENVQSAADRAADLTRQLLAFSRRQVLDMKVLNLNTVLKNLDKMLHRIIGEDVELVNLLAEDLGRVKADTGQIEQVIMNIAVNARDAMPNGGKLTIETANVELDEEYARAHIAVTPGRYVMLSFSDTGVGMTREIKDRVFEPFFTTKETGKGTGLGLSTVYGIVKQSGGNIWVYSELGKGTTFKIYLPRMDEPSEEIKEKVVEEKILRGDETVLVVEDEEVVRKLAVRILGEQGYKVLEASQGIDAFLICGEHDGPIHLLLTDVVMPKMSGRELANSIISLRPGIKVLYMSGYTDNAIVHHGILIEGMNYIQKPFTLESLARKVREVLDK